MEYVIQLKYFKENVNVLICTKITFFKRRKILHLVGTIFLMLKMDLRQKYIAHLGMDLDFSTYIFHAVGTDDAHFSPLRSSFP